MALATANDIQEIYIAYYGRPADPAGLDYWLDRVNTDHEGDLTAIIEAFGASAEATELFGDRTSAESVTALYQQLFGRDPEATGLQFYVDGLAAGTYTLVSIAKNILDGATTGDDATVVANRTTVANNFTAELRVDGTYAGDDAAAVARAFLATVDKTTASKTAALADLSATLADVAAGAAAVENNLTTAAETVTGTAGRDVFYGDISSLSSVRTLNTNDSIAGGDGADAAYFDVSGSFGGFNTAGAMTGVETVTFTNTGSIARTVNMTGFSGVEKIVLENGTGITNLEDIPAAGITLRVDGQAGALTASFEAEAVEEDDDSVTIELASSAITSLTMADVEAVTVKNLGTGTSSISLASTSFEELTTTGAGSLTVTASGTSLTEIDGSGRTGTTTYSSVGAAVATIVGGTGNDSITSTTGTSGTLSSVETGAGVDTVTVSVSALRANATVDGGDGNDTLVLTSGASGTFQLSLSDVENLQVGALTGDLVFDGTNVDGLNQLILTASSTTADVTLANIAEDDFTVQLKDALSGAGKTVTVDNEGTLSITRTATSTTAKTGIAAVTDVVATAADAVELTLNAYTGYSGTITAADALSVIVTQTAASLNSTGTASASSSGFSGKVVAASAEEFNVTAAGLLSGSLDLESATSGTITSTSTLDSNSMTLDTPDLEALTLTVGNTFTVTNTDVASLQQLTATATKGTLTLGAFAALNQATVTGTGTTTALSMGNLGASTLDYALNLDVIGFKGGATIGTVNGAANVDLDLSAATGAKTVGTIGATTGTVTVDLSGGTGAISFGAITAAAGAVRMDLSNTSGAITSGAISGTAVTIDLSGTTGTFNGGSAYGVSAKTSLNFEGQDTKANLVNLTATGTSVTATLNGGILTDTFSVTSQTTTTSITVTGAMEIEASGGSDTLTITHSYSGTAANSVNVSGVTGAEKITLTGSNTTGTTFTGSAGKDSITAGDGNDTISGGAGADTIQGGVGSDSMTGGSGNDAFVYNGTANETGVVTLSAAVTVGTTFSIGTSGYDVITDFATGDAVVLGSNYDTPTTVITATAGTLTTTQIDYFDTRDSTYAMAVLRGDYASGVFTTSASGADSIVLFDQATAASGVVQFVLLVGYAGATADDDGTVSVTDGGTSYTGLIGGGA